VGVDYSVVEVELEEPSMSSSSWVSSSFCSFLGLSSSSIEDSSGGCSFISSDEEASLDVLDSFVSEVLSDSVVLSASEEEAYS